jgi:hypothetical protein
MPNSGAKRLNEQQDILSNRLRLGQLLSTHLVVGCEIPVHWMKLVWSWPIFLLGTMSRDWSGHGN